MRPFKVRAENGQEFRIQLKQAEIDGSQGGCGKAIRPIGQLVTDENHRVRSLGDGVFRILDLDLLVTKIEE